MTLAMVICRRAKACPSRGNGITIEVLDTMNAPASISVRITVESSDVPAVPGLNRALIALLTIVTVATASFGLGPNKKRA